MKFYSYETLYSACKQAREFDAEKMPWDRWYPMMRRLSQKMHDNVGVSQLSLEYNWTVAKQPYYNVWPAIIPPLLKLNLALSSAHLHPPKEELLIRLPDERNPLKFEFRGEHYSVRCIMLVQIMVRQLNCPGVGLYIDFGEKMGIQPIRTFQNMVCNGEKSLEEEIDSIPEFWHANVGVRMPRDILKDCVRLCCTLCLLENDPEVITADVLNKDKAKFEHEPDERLVDKAHRCGKFGWDIGKKMTVSPHYRIPHSCLFWTGVGRTKPVIKIRAGTVVHRKKIEKIPTGHLLKDDGEPKEEEQ